MKITKRLTLATVAALTIGTGAAMAQEGDAQFLRPSQIPTPTVQWFVSDPGSSAANPATGKAPSVTTMFGQSHPDTPFSPVPDGSDGSGS